MDSLPVELLRLIFRFCDSDSVKCLRAASGKLAEVGYDYLVPPVFRSLPWRDDMRRLHNIASHDRLRGSIESVVINLSQMDEYNGRHTSYLQHFFQDPEERSEMLHDAWVRYYQAEEHRKDVPSLQSQSDLVHEALARLPSLRDLSVTFTESPHDIEAIREVFRLPACHKMDRKQACEDLGVLISAISGASLSSLQVDRLPLELFKLRHHRQHWFECGPALAGLSRLDITIDPSKILLPNSKFRAMNGLGHFLRYAENVTHLSLGFHNYANPREKFSLWFGDLFGDFTFGKLTDLKLEGMACDEDDLKAFLVRHGPTLERLRLGGHWVAKLYEPGLGGIHLCRGTFRSLFASLRKKLPKLERVHLQGDFECGMLDAGSHERYNFHAVTDGNWHAVGDEGRPRTAPRNTTNCLEFERYLLHGGEYPGSLRASPAASPDTSPGATPPPQTQETAQVV